jgi:hypothetical protein
MRYTLMIDIDDDTRAMSVVSCIPGEKIREGEFPYPPKWGEKSKAALNAWARRKHEQCYPLSDEQVQALIYKYANEPRKFVALVDRAISHNWSQLNDQIPLTQPKTSIAVANQSKTIESVKQILEEAGHEVRRD